MNVELIRLDDPDWLRFLRQRPDATAFHQPWWAEAVASCYGFAARALVVRRDGSILAGVPFTTVRGITGSTRSVALPFSDHCAFLGASGLRAHELDDVVATLRASRTAPLEVRGPRPGPGVPSAPQGYRHTLDIGRRDDELLASMDRTHRAAIRRATDAGIEVHRHGEDGLEDFYQLQVRTRRRLGVPVQPRRLFARLGEYVLRPGHGYVLVARWKGSPVAAGLFLTHADTTVFKYSASDESAWAMRPNHLIAWTAIRTARDAGMSVLDWGRTDLAGDGLRRYKLAFGSHEETLVHSWLGARERAAFAVPSAAQFLIRRGPAWVCRLSGELLYRYSA